MSVMQKIFGSPKPAPAMEVQNPGANPATVTNQPSGTAANAPAVKTLPLDEFKDIWQPTATDPNADPFSKPLLTHDPAKLSEAVSKMNFMDGVDPGLVTKALAGDAQALIQVVNAAAQKSFAASTQLNSNMLETSFKTNNERVNSTLPKKVREAQINSMQSENPVLNHAAAAPMLDMAKRAISNKNPDLSPAQVQARAEQYISDFAGSLTTQQQTAAKPTGPDPFDFSDY